MAKKQISPTEILIVAGEHSGDLLGAELVKELLKKQSALHFFGVGGSEMTALGVESYADMEQMTVIGFSGILSKYGYLKNLLHRLVTECETRNAKTAILIDYPGFNLRLARELHAKGIRTIFYVSPQIWAWKFKRIFTIKKYIDLMLVLFRFEEKLYHDYQVNAVFVGHPVMYRIQQSIKTETRLKKSGDITITLMPGSRSGEIKKHLPDMLLAAQKIRQELGKNIRFLIPNINRKEQEYIQTSIKEFNQKHLLQLQYCFHCSLNAVSQSDLVILSSGTATLEVTYFEKPMIIIYKISNLTYILGKLLVKTKFIGLVNILAGKGVCREFIQKDCTPENISNEALQILTNTNYRKSMVDSIKKVKQGLSKGKNPAVIAAGEIKALLDKR